MADDGLREIQLRGKHLVSLFMTSAVLLVVTFLCGVLVGRGVRAQKEPVLMPGAAAGSAAAEDPTASVVPLQPTAKSSAAAPAQAPTQPPPQADEDLSYYSRLEGKSAPPESAKPVPRTEAPVKSEPAARQAVAPAPAAPAARPATPPEKPAAQPSKSAASSQQTPATPSARPAEQAASADPAGAGYVVKIVAYKDRAQSNALVARLVGKGYAAYVVTVPGKSAPLYSVRVGRFKTRADADAAKRRLEKEEQFKPLVTR